MLERNFSLDTEQRSTDIRRAWEMETIKRIGSHTAPTAWDRLTLQLGEFLIASGEKIKAASAFSKMTEDCA
jgi:hypothetical protein